MQAPWLYKLLRYEYWPWYVFYLPMIPIYLYGVVTTRRWLYFTAVNPSIFMGGFFGEHKDEIMHLIPDGFQPRMVCVSGGSANVLELMEQNGIKFPVVAKPIVGERGYHVRILVNAEELDEYQRFGEDYMIQEYIDEPLELGVLYVRNVDDGSVRVTSITQKEFMTVIGDGASTVGDLVRRHPRYRLYLSYLEDAFSDRLRIVPRDGEQFEVHCIGNHVKGTRFIDANAMIELEVNAVISKLAQKIDGVNIGRFDMKVPSYLHLHAGEGIKVFELNGVSSEPGHVYAQRNFFRAIVSLTAHWLDIIDVARKQIKKGVETTPLKVFYRAMKQHFLD